ncbi:MAG: BON domain-containing protein [Hyphomicrobiaceae bacterium]|nr:BON domain-containing protein [Hyphomicrobiaceae bacterium]
MPDEPAATRSNDLIAEDILAGLEAAPEIDATEVDIDVDRGVVALNGTVDTYAVKELAGAIAQRVAGVGDVHNRLRIRKDAGVLPDVRFKRLRIAK